jgi:predicted kinase
MSTGTPNNEKEDDEWESVPTKEEKKKKRNRDQREDDGNPPLPWLANLLKSCTRPEFDDHSRPFSEPTILLLAGLPGSGKSTFAKSLEQLQPWKYVRINQDELKSRDQCLAFTRQTLLLERKCAIIDRCNVNLAQRQHFVKLATSVAAEATVTTSKKTSEDKTGENNGDSVDNNKCNVNVASEFRVVHVDCIAFDLTREVCESRCRARRNHPTLNRSDISRVLSQMQSEWEAPNARREGFRHVQNVTNDQDFRLIFESLLRF